MLERRLLFAFLQLDSMLLGEDAGQRKCRQVTVADDDLAEEPPATRLLGERLLELVLGQ